MSSSLKEGHIVPVDDSAGPKGFAMSTTTLTTPPPNRRDRGILRSLVVMFVACCGLVVFTVVLGIQANSIALISDATLMATDAVTYVVAIGMEVGGLKVRGRRRINDRCGARINLAILLGANAYIMVDASRALYAAGHVAADPGGGTVAAPEEVDGVTMMWATSLNLVVDVLVYIVYRRMISEQTKRRVAARAGSLPAVDEVACLESEDGGAGLEAGGRAVVDGRFDGASHVLLGVPMASGASDARAPRTPSSPPPSSSPSWQSPLAAATATSPLHQQGPEAPTIESQPPSSRCKAGMSCACQPGARVSGNSMQQSICNNSLHAQVAHVDDDDEEDSPEELNLKAALAHLFADGLRSVGVLVSGALIALELAPGVVTDAACALFITLFIIVAVAGLTKRAFSCRWRDIVREAQVLRGRRRDDKV